MICRSGIVSARKVVNGRITHVASRQHEHLADGEDLVLASLALLSSVSYKLQKQKGAYLLALL